MVMVRKSWMRGLVMQDASTSMLLTACHGVDDALRIAPLDRPHLTPCPLSFPLFGLGSIQSLLTVFFVLVSSFLLFLLLRFCYLFQSPLLMVQRECHVAGIHSRDR